MKLSIKDKKKLLRVMRKIERNMKVIYSGCIDEEVATSPYQGMWDELKEMIENG